MSTVNPSHEVTIAGEKYKLRYTLYAADKVEELTGEPFGDVLDGFAEGAVRYGKMLTILWAGMLFHHEEITRDSIAKKMNARDLLDPNFQKVLVAAMRDFFPEISKEEVENVEENTDPPE